METQGTRYSNTGNVQAQPSTGQRTGRKKSGTVLWYSTLSHAIFWTEMLEKESFLRTNVQQLWSAFRDGGLTRMCGMLEEACPCHPCPGPLPLPSRCCHVPSGSGDMASLAKRLS